MIRKNAGKRDSNIHPNLPLASLDFEKVELEIFGEVFDFDQGVVLLDKQGEIVWCSQSLKSLLIGVPEQGNTGDGALLAEIQSAIKAFDQTGTTFDTCINTITRQWLRVKVEKSEEEQYIVSVNNVTDMMNGYRKLELYAELVDRLPVGLAIYQLQEPDKGGDLTLVACNPQVSEELGFDYQKYVGKSMLDIFPDLSQTDIPALCGEVVRTGIVKEQEYHQEESRLIQAGIYRMQLFPLPQDCVGIHYSNITQQYELEETQRLSERRYEEIYNRTPAMLHSIGKDGAIVSVSDYWLEIMEYTREEVIGRKSIDFLTEESRKYALEVVLKEFFARGYCTNVPYQFVKKGGEVIDVHLSAISEKDENGEVTRSLAVISDVSDLKKTERALLESEERLYLAVRGTQDGVWDWMDIQNDNQWWSSQFYELLGYKEDEIEGSSKKFRSLMHPEDLPRTIEGVRACFEEDIPLDVEYRLKTKQGDYRWFRSRGNVIRNEKGEPIRMAGAISDINDRKESEKELIKTNENLEQFTYIATHDLKAPINNIEGLLEIMYQDPEVQPGEKLTQYLKWIEKSVDKARKTIIDLVTIVKAQKEELIMMQEINLETLLQEVLDEMQMAIETSGTKVQLDLQVKSIWYSPIHAQSMMQNLIGNALKFRSEERLSEIVVRTEKQDGFVNLKVIDNGIGIDLDKDLSKVFAMFKRAHNHVEGTGLGLYLVKMFLEKSGGTISVDSTLGEGTTFSILIKDKE